MKKQDIKEIIEILALTAVSSMIVLHINAMGHRVMNLKDSEKVEKVQPINVVKNDSVLKKCGRFYPACFFIYNQYCCNFNFVFVSSNYVNFRLGIYNYGKRNIVI